MQWTNRAKVLVIAVLFCLSLFLVNCGTTQPTHDPIGGKWSFPINRSFVNTNIIVLQAEAYPTDRNVDPQITSVNFTIGVGDPAVWSVLCTSTKPIFGDTYECRADLTAYMYAPDKIGVPPGSIQVSFDPKNVKGEIHKAPNGVHDLSYGPGYQFPTKLGGQPTIQILSNCLTYQGETGDSFHDYDSKVPNQGIAKVGTSITKKWIVHNACSIPVNFTLKLSNFSGATREQVKTFSFPEPPIANNADGIVTAEIPVPPIPGYQERFYELVVGSCGTISSCIRVGPPLFAAFEAK